ncbi:MAG: multicopper oxidase domain-containing protein, partial [Gemmatimonadales bacterium]
LSPIVFNDNRFAAGAVTNGTLSVSLVAGAGDWRPFGADSTGVPMLAFGEAGRPLQDPGPLLRVRQGTRIAVTLHNLTGSPLVVHGLSARRVTVMDSLVIAPGATGSSTFTADAVGTYYYWGATHGERFEERFLDDAHLNGALIVDPPAPAAPKSDRVFVVELYTPDTVAASGAPDAAHMIFSINGRPWPFTERLTYDLGDSVRWRFVNASADVHPFHMHGFFYRVDARGDFRRDTIYWPDQQRHVVTEPMLNGSTMDMAWQPDRPGGWIFHCHFNLHVPPNAALPPDTEPTPLRIQHVLNGYPGMSVTNHAMTGMGGLVLGLYVRPPAGWHPYTGARRTLRLLVESDSAPGDSTRKYRYALDEGGRVTVSNSPQPYGPAIILHRGEPTRIWIVNHTAEMTQVHWHGLEVESGIDGVVGVSGTPGAMEPGIMPGDSFAVNVTPPRAGSYMYHTHVNDIHQQTNGLYGPLIVLDSGMTWNPDADRIFIVGDNAAVRPVLNGGNTATPMLLKVDTPYRLRLMNITVTNPALYFQLTKGGAVTHWTPIAKDAWPLPPWQRDSVEAKQNVNIGETFDFVVQRADTGSTQLELRNRAGRLVARQVIRFVK